MLDNIAKDDLQDEFDDAMPPSQGGEDDIISVLFDDPQDAGDDADDNTPTALSDDVEVLDSDVTASHNVGHGDAVSDDGAGRIGNGYRDYFSDEDMLVPMPQAATVITGNAVEATGSGASGRSRAYGEGMLSPNRYRVSVGATFAGLFVGLAIGVVSTFLVMNGIPGKAASDPDKTTTIPSKVNKGELSLEMVSYEYDGKSRSMSIEDVIEATGSLDSMKSDGDMYSVPSAEKAIEAVRNTVILDEAKKHGIEVSDGAIADYVADSYGLATVDELAQQVGLDVEETERQLTERIVIKALKDEVTGAQDLIPLVEPMSPDDGDPATMSERYGEYIRSLAGDEWNATDNVWSDPEGVFAKALGDDMFDGHVASYDMARKVYDVVRHRNDEIQSGIDGAWSDYLNDLFRKVNVKVMTISR